MPANISMVGGISEMAFVGEKPWHGLGQELTEGQPLEVWAREAGMEWRVLRSKVRFETDRSGAAPQVWEDRHVLFRSDTKKPLGVVSDRYKVVQPIEVLRFFTDVARENGLQLNTAGTLDGGARYWALAKTGQSLRLAGVDVVDGYVLLATSADGSMATTGKFTSIRVVCANTLGIALRDGKQAVKVRHSTEFDAHGVRVDLGIIDSAWQEFATNAARLAETRVTNQSALAVLVKAIGDEEQFRRDLADKGTVSAALDEQPNKRQMAEIMQLFDGRAIGSDSVTSRGTAWGLVNAATQYYDHAAGRSPDTRLSSAWFGATADRKQSIMREALALPV